jgi:hypothetical protein
VSIVTSLLYSLRFLVRSRAALHLEIVALRHQLVVALDKDTPCSRPVTPPSAGRIVVIPEVGGLHHRYERIAA